MSKIDGCHCFKYVVAEVEVVFLGCIVRPDNVQYNNAALELNQRLAQTFRFMPGCDFWYLRGRLSVTHDRSSFLIDPRGVHLSPAGYHELFRVHSFRLEATIR